MNLLVDSSEKCPDLLYLSKFMAPDDFIFISSSDENYCIVGPLEYDRAKASVPNNVQVIEFSEIAPYGTKLATVLHEAARKFHIDTYRIPAYFPVAIADALRKNGMNIKVETGEFIKARQIKSQDEISFITQAQRAAEAGLAAAINAIGSASINLLNQLTLDGEVLTSERLRTIINTAIVAHDAVGTGTIASCGSHAAMPHHCGAGPLMANETIVMDIFPRNSSTGYWGDLTRTVVKGRAQDITKKAFYAVKEARDRVIEEMHAGLPARDMHILAAGILEQHHFLTGANERGNYGFFHGLGHGVGLEIHEHPRLNRSTPEILQCNMVTTVEPGLYYPEWGGIRLEDLVVINADNVTNLTQAPTFLEIE